MTAFKEILVPDIGDFKNVEVIELFVQAGDTITEGMDLLTLETDKAAIDVPSPVSGCVRELLVAKGSRVSEGSLLMRVELEDDGAGDGADNSAATEPAPPPASATVAGSVPEADSAPDITPQPSAALQTAGPVATPSDYDLQAYASPSIRKLARELNVSLAKVPATGPKGRITRDDLLGHVREALANVEASAPAGGMPGLPPWPKIDFSKFGEIERQDLSRIRKISGPNLHRNWVMIPHVTNHEEADITELESFRIELNKDLAASGVKVTLLALLMKACVATLKKFPEFNASLDGEQIILKKYYHIGFAADTPNGLVVPVIRDADKKGIASIAKEMSDLAAKARDGKLGPNDMSGGSFSISSLGGIGGTYFTPIINAPEVAILGVGKSQTRVVWNGQGAEPRLILPLSLSWDHRAVDGAAAGRFNAYLAKALRDLRRVLI